MGCGVDPYSSGRWVNTLPGGHRRTASDVYWNIRAAAGSVREYFSLFYTGPRSGQEYKDLWLFALSVDLSLQRTYDAQGYGAVLYALNTDDRFEHWLSRIASQITLLRTGDKSLAQEMQTGGPPGDADLFPHWALEAGRSVTKAEYQARQRSGQGYGRGGQSLWPASSAPDSSGDRRPRRRAKATAAATSGGGASSSSAGATKPASGR